MCEVGGHEGPVAFGGHNGVTIKLLELELGCPILILLFNYGNSIIGYGRSIVGYG